MAVTIQCFNCGHKMQHEPPISRSMSCKNCQSDVRACKNCQFFDANSYRSCREERAEWVQDSEKANFCGYFVVSSKDKCLEKSTQEHLTKLDELFNKDAKNCKNDQLSQESSLEHQIKEFLNKKK